MRKTLLAATCLTASLLALPATSHAICTLTGQVVRITAYSDPYSPTAGYIYFRVSALSPYYYYVSTADDDMIVVAQGYLNSGRDVSIQGNVASCPAVPAAGGSASLGTLNYLYTP